MGKVIIAWECCLSKSERRWVMEKREKGHGFWRNEKNKDKLQWRSFNFRSVHSDLSINLFIISPHLLEVKTSWFSFLLKIVFSKHYSCVEYERRRMQKALKGVVVIIGSKNVITQLGVFPGRIHLIRDIEQMHYTFKKSPAGLTEWE